MLANDVSIRPARAEDADAAVPLIFSSGPDSYRYVFEAPGFDAVEFIRFAFTEGSGYLGYRNHVVVELAGQIVGTGSFYASAQYRRLGRESLRQAMIHYGVVNLVRVMRQSGAVTAMMPPPPPAAEYFANLAVREELRGRGIGGRLMAHGIARAADEGQHFCVLDVADDNAPAIGLYRRHGFRDGETTAFPGSRERWNVPDHRRMMLELAP